LNNVTNLIAGALLLAMAGIAVWLWWRIWRQTANSTLKRAEKKARPSAAITGETAAAGGARSAGQSGTSWPTGLLVKYEAKPAPPAPNNRQGVSPSALQELTVWVSEFPPLPATTARILSELRSPQSSPARIAKLVGYDPVLTAAVLRMANSAAVAPGKEVTTLELAILLLGQDAVQAIALRGTMAGLISQPAGFDTDALWRHCAATSMFAGALARRITGVEREEASTAGLLHDLGRLLMNVRHPSGMVELIDTTTTVLGESRLAKEERIFGACHTVFGALLSSRWQLPGPLVDAIELHHNPRVMELRTVSERVRRLSGTVFIANQLSKIAGCAADDREIDLPTDELFSTLGLQGDYDRLLQGLMPEVRVPLSAFLAEASSAQNPAA
jgi:putative nucleotidyltransferase with HDIG domain